jgi:DNA repair exonuclease SbcCD ATPase subunit
MLKLKRLNISNVGRFVGDHTIDFSSKKYLIQVDGQNKNTGGSSGSGKSTIFNSLEYLLGINSLPSTVLQSRLTKNHMAVSASFDLDGKDIVISRSKSEGLAISVDGVDIVSGNNKAAEEKLDSILGIQRDLLRKMIHKRQKEGGFFLNLTPKESHAFLIDSLGLEAWAKKTQLIEEDIKAKNSRLLYISGLLESSKKSLETTEVTLASIEMPVLGFDPAVIPSIRSSLQKAIEFEKTLSKQLSEELESIGEVPKPDQNQDKTKLNFLKINLSELEAQEKFERNEYSEKLSIANQEHATLDKKLGETRRFVSIGQSSAFELEKIKTKITHIKNGTCPTCRQGWVESRNELENLTKQAKALFLDIQKGKSAEDEIPGIVTAIEEKAKEIQKIKNESVCLPISEKIAGLKIDIDIEMSRLANELSLINQAYQDQIQKNKEKESAIRAKYSDKLTASRYNVQEHTRLLAEKEASLSSYRSSMDLYEKNRESLRLALEASRKKYEEALGEKAEIEVSLQVASDALALIKSYTNTLFQDALDHIANKATDILSKIPNMSTSTIYFEGFKETKTGTIKEEVSAIVTMDGEVGIPVKSMSGGERTAIDLAVDLAVIDMVEELAGKGIDIFILDEPFDGLDSICREQCLEILKTHVTDKKIIVVDHSNETKEMVSDRIIVSRDGNESSILEQ